VTESWTVRRIGAWMQADFARRGIESPRLDADLLLAQALGLKRIALYMDPDRPLDESELGRVRALVERRRKREPIAYIVGEREFYGRAFQVDRAVLIPRPDTEALVEAAKTFLGAGPSGALLDVCTGSGAVAVTLAAECPELSVVASDISSGALEVARANVARHGLLERVSLREGDLFAVVGEGERFAAITVNPPYIGRAELAQLEADVRDYEPRLALDAGDDALSFYRRIARDAPVCLLEGGGLFVEVGFDQAQAVCALFAAAGLRDVRAQRDLNGIERVVIGVR
jgi:release factor glutamine methyltransferase